MRFLAALACALLSLAAAAQSDEAARARFATLEKAVAERPDDAALRFFLARAQARAGDKRGALDSLAKAAELGDGFLPPRDGFDDMWGDADFIALRAKLEAKLPRLDYAPVAVELEDRTLIPEGLGYDMPSHTFFMGSLARHRVVAIDSSGAASVFAEGEDLDSILGIAVDAPRRVLYAVSTSALIASPALKRRNAVLAFDVDSRRFLRRYEVPGAAQLNDVAIAPGGRVFCTDSESGAVYEIAVKGPGPTREVVPAGRLRGSNGLAASPDAKRLYVAHATGLAMVDLDSGALKPVANETRENFAAIDGLYAWQGQLVGVQNVTTPGRVILLTLSRAGDSVTRVQTLLSHHHNRLDEPTTGAVGEGGTFYLLAATGVSHFSRAGRIEDPDTVPPPTVLRVPLTR